MTICARCMSAPPPEFIDVMHAATNRSLDCWAPLFFLVGPESHLYLECHVRVRHMDVSVVDVPKKITRETQYWPTEHCWALFWMAILFPSRLLGDHTILTVSSTSLLMTSASQMQRSPVCPPLACRTPICTLSDAPSSLQADRHVHSTRRCRICRTSSDRPASQLARHRRRTHHACGV